MAVAERIDYSEYQSQAQLPRVSEEDADDLFRRMQAQTLRAEKAQSLPSGWWILGLAPLGLSFWIGLGIWIFG
ncbi:hypothetical protein V8J36_10730 [Frigidibacter sp. MR17.14]|uniref:hypothetical protein n=1 Tax=Frigidibacter sp. MR17.14 TaxID=3126509 RepID=UPI003013009C